MEEIKSQNSEDAAAPVKRVLRSRIIEVDNSSNGSCASNGVDGPVVIQNDEETHTVAEKEPLASHSTPIKRSLRNKTTSSSSLSDKGDVQTDHIVVTSKNEDSNETDLKTISPDDKRKRNMTDDNESHSSMSPTSQCGSEASGVNVRVLRNSKCVLIPLESLDKLTNTHKDGSGNADVKSKKVPLSSIREESEEKGHDVNDKVNEEDEKSSENKENEADIIVPDSLVDETLCDSNRKNIKAVNISDENVSNSNDNADESDKQADDNHNNENNTVDESTNDDGCTNGKSNGVVIEETEDQEYRLCMPDEASADVSSLKNDNTDVSCNIKETIEEKSNDHDQSLVTERSENSTNDIDWEDHGSDTPDEFECIGNLENVTKRKPVKLTDANKVLNIEEKIQETQKTNVEENTADDTVMAIIGDTVVDNETEDELALQTGNCVISETILESDGTQENKITDETVSKDSDTTVISVDGDKEQSSTAEDKKSTVSLNKKSATIRTELSEEIAVTEINDTSDVADRNKNEDQGSVVCEELSKNIELSDSDKDSSDDEIEISSFKQSKVNESTMKNVRKFSEPSSQPDENILVHKKTNPKFYKPASNVNQTRSSIVNISKVLNLLTADENRKPNTVVEEEEDSSSGNGGVTGQSKVKVRKRVMIDTDPVQYHGIGKDLLKDIVKEAVAGAVVDLKQELCNVKQQLTNVTSILDEIRRGKKRKLDDTNLEEEEEDDDNDDKQSLISSSSEFGSLEEIAPKIAVRQSKENPSSPLKGNKTKEDLIKELMDDVSDHLQKPVKKKKKIHLSEAQRRDSCKKKKKEKKFANIETPYTNEPVESVPSDDYNFSVLTIGANKKKKKKKLQLLREEGNLTLSTDIVNKNKKSDKSVPQEIYDLDKILPVKDVNFSKLLQKKKKKKKLDEYQNLDDGGFENDVELLYDANQVDEVSNDAKENDKVKKKKKKNKNKSSVVPISDDVVSASNFIDKQFSLMEGESKKKKKKIDTATKSTTQPEISHGREITDYSENEIETDKKKKKKKNKLNATLSESNVDKTSKFSSFYPFSKEQFSPSSLHGSKQNKMTKSDDFNVSEVTSKPEKLKKKKKKQKLAGDDSFSTFSSNLSSNNELAKAISSENTDFENSSYQNEERLLKKMKSWKSTNKNHSYRATPYKDSKNKKNKFDNSMSF